MKNFFYETLSKVFAGVLVAAVGFYVFSVRENTVDLKYSFNSIPFGNQINLSLLDETLELLEELNVDTTKKLNRDIIVEYADNGIFALSGEMEFLEIHNPEETRSIEVLIEGRNNDLTFIRSKNNGKISKKDSFNETVKILPNETVEIYNIVQGRSLIRSIYTPQDSQNISISTEGIYLKPLQTSTILNEIFGDYLLIYPLIFLLLIICGLIFSPVIFVNIILLLSTRWRYFTLKSVGDIETMALYKVLLEDIEQTEQEKWLEIESKSVRYKNFPSINEGVSKE